MYGVSLTWTMRRSGKPPPGLSVRSLESFQPTLVSTTRVTEKSKLEYPTIHFGYKFIFFKKRKYLDR